MDIGITTAITCHGTRARGMSRAGPVLAGVVAACCMAAPAAATEWGASAGGGLAYSDNFTRTPDGQSISVALADVSAQFLDIGRTYDVDMEAALIFRDYFDSAYQSDTLPQFRGEANWAPIPERLAWTVRENFGQVALTPADSLQPSDRQDVSIFSTGPAISLPMGRRWNFQLAGLFSDVYYENDDFDNNRLTGTMTVEREISRNQNAYIRGFTGRTEFKDEQFGGYDIHGLFLGYNGQGTRTGVTAEVGTEELHDRGEVNDAVYVSLDIDRRLSQRVNASLRYISRYAGAAEIFSLDQDLEPQLGGTTNIQVSGDPIAQDRASFEVNWEGLRSSAGFMTMWSTENSDSTALPDREIYGLSVRAGRRLSSSTRIGANAYFLREERRGVVDESQDDYAMSLEFEWRIGEKTSLLTQIERYSRTNSPGDYDENRIVVLLRYTPRAISNNLPSFFERRLDRRFVIGEPEREE